MFEREAHWVADILNKLSPEGVVLNLGSSDLQFRNVTQPWIDKLIFAPLRARGTSVIHVDLREGEGIDIRADILKPQDFDRLSTCKPDIILCCNLLEHVEDSEALAQAC